MKAKDIADLGPALFEEAGDALFLFDPDTDELQDVNPTAQLLSGFSRQELMCMPATFLFRFEGKGGMFRLKNATEHTGVFHSQDGYFLRTRMEGVWVPVSLTVARLHVQPKVLGLVTARDVRQQREALNQVKKVEAELRRVIAAVSDCLWSAAIDKTHQWTYRYLSPVIEKITGRPPDFFRLGLSQWRRVVHPDDRAAWEKAVARLKAGRSNQEEYRIVHPNGTIRWVRDSVSVSHGDDDQLLRFDGVLTDTTEQKRADESLRSAENKYRSIFENAIEGIYQSDAEGRFVTVNPMLAHILRFNSPEELLASATQEFYAEPGRRADFAHLIHEHGAMTNFESEILRRDGSRAWVAENARALHAADGSLIGYEGTMVDITARKLAETALAHERALLRSLIDSIPDLIFYKDREGRYLGCNVAFEKYWGCAAKEVAGKTDADLLPLERAESFRARDVQVLAERKPRRDEEWIEPRNGRRMLVETLQTPFFGPDGQVLGLIGMSRDITERKRLEEQLRQAQKMEAIGQLAGGIAHDFNNLLTAIVGNVSLLLATKAAPDADFELLAATEQAAQRATDLTRQLLGFSRQTVLSLEPTNLGASIKEIVAILRRTIDPRIAVEVQADADLWTVQADSGQMNQVLMNLCLNARDAMPNGGRLVLQATNADIDSHNGRQQIDARPGAFVRLRVQDTGHGIPPEVKPRIFEPFFTTKGPGKGTGLGLAMVYGIIQQHQGWIECDSEVGRGTHFDIYLPRVHDQPVKAKAQQSTAGSSSGTETLLLVDDEAVIRNVGRAILQRKGYRVLLAADGQEAIDIYQREQKRIGLIILDMTMPRLSGRDTLRQLLSINPEVQVLLSSGYTADSMPEVGKEGVLGFVAKPYRPQDLTQAVRSALDRIKHGPRGEARPEGPPERDPEQWVI